MSRIGKLPVEIPSGVTVSVGEHSFTVKGPKGELTQEYKPDVQINVQEGIAEVVTTKETLQAGAYHGLYRKLLSNMVTGVSQGFSKTLLINGVGYRAEVKGDILVLNLGYSNPIYFQIPSDLQITCEGANKVVVSGIDKQKVGQTSAEIRSLRPPEPYKGKGVKYEDEIIRRKIGKAGVK
ncbi:MAG: 50S ribosomal protein L6 [Spirochaetales bacterium]|nr:50S ribosomal protein L6 [Spirochaetales bacterium]